MSQQNVESVGRGYEHFRGTGDFLQENFGPDFVWDMSTFRDWPEQHTYQGLEGARTFISDWVEAWHEWELEIESLHDAGDKVVAILHQRGRSKATGVPVEMRFAQVWTMRDGKQVRMEMYATPDEGLEAAGLTE
jgi:ketosteroid isomerase-like protein